jgi:hypothetical protein
MAVKRVRAAGTPGRAKPPRVASGSLRAGKRALATPGRPGVRKIAASHASVAAQERPSALRFRTFQVCPKDLPSRSVAR